MWDYPTKVANNGATLAGKHLAVEFDNYMAEILAAIEASGVTLTTYPTDPTTATDPDTSMLAQTLSRMASLGVYGTDSGTANAYVVSPASGVVAPKALRTGLMVILVPGHTNTTASTANVFSLGVKALRTYDDADLTGSEIVAGKPTAWRYDETANSSAGAWLLLPWAVSIDLAAVADAVLNTGSQIYSTHGSYTFTVPAGVTRVRVRLWGAGGGGGGAQANGLGGSGGNGGGYAEGNIAVTPGGTVTVTVGTGGTAGYDNGNGGSGGTTSFGTTIQATGGQGGLFGSASAPGYTPNTVGVGSGTNSKLSLSGSRGGQGGGPANGYGAIGGFGGSSPMGGGNCPGTTGSGNTGQAPGGGGSGAGGFTGSAALAGGGADGMVVIEWVNI